MTVTKVYPEFESVAGGTATATATHDVTIPSSIEAGDTAVVVIVIEDARTLDEDALFDVLWSASDASSGITVTALGHTITTPDLSAGTWTFTASGSTEWASTTVVYNGTCTFAGGSGDGADLVTPALTEDQGTLADQATGILYIGGARGTSTIGFTAPGGFTERADYGHSSGAIRLRVTVADDSEWTFGDVGPWTGTASGTPTKMVAGYLAVLGQLDYTVPDFPDGPNEPFGFDVPFADGVHRVYRGWSGGLLLVQANIGGSAFRLNDDTYGRLNTAKLGPANDGWVDLGADFLSVDIAAGGTTDDGVLTRMEAGRATLTLADWEGAWDPMNADSPYAQDWRLGCRIRVHGGAVEQLDIHNPAADTVATAMPGLFNGTVDDIVASGWADENPVVTVSIVDDVVLLTNANPPAASSQGAGDTLEERVQRIVDNAGWGGALAADTTHPEWPTGTYQATTMAAAAWTEILAACDAGLVGPVIRGDGDLYLSPIAPNTFLYRAHQFGPTLGSDTPMVDVEVAYNREQLRNVVTLARVGGTEQTATDQNSITRQGGGLAGRFDYSRNDLTLDDDADVAALATRILGYSSDPTPRVTAISVWPQINVPANGGANLYGDVAVWFAGSLLTTVSYPVYLTLCQIVRERFSNADLIEVSFTHPMTGREITQLVQVRGCQVRITDDEWQFRFVTSSVDAWFDIWTLADPSDTLEEAEQSRLSRGHRLAAA